MHVYVQKRYASEKKESRVYRPKQKKWVFLKGRKTQFHWEKLGSSGNGHQPTEKEVRVAFADVNPMQNPTTKLRILATETLEPSRKEHKATDLFTRLWIARVQASVHAPHHSTQVLGTKVPQNPSLQTLLILPACEGSSVSSKAKSWELQSHHTEDSEGSEYKNRISKVEKITKVIKMETWKIKHLKKKKKLNISKRKQSLMESWCPKASLSCLPFQFP